MSELLAPLLLLLLALARLLLLPLSFASAFLLPTDARVLVDVRVPGVGWTVVFAGPSDETAPARRLATAATIDRLALHVGFHCRLDKEHKQGPNSENEASNVWSQTTEIHSQTTIFKSEIYYLFIVQFWISLFLFYANLILLHLDYNIN